MPCQHPWQCTWSACHVTCCNAAIVLAACQSAARRLSAGATELTNQQAASVSSQAAQAMQVLDLHFGAAACLEFLSELLPRDPYANAEEPARLTSAQVCF